MRLLFRLVVLLVVLSAVAWALAFSGWYNVAATEPHWKPVRQFLMFGMDRSVEHHAEGIAAPGNLADTAVIHKGFEHYQEMCVECHGAPGVKRSEMAEGLNPKPPRLLYAAKEMKPGELFWITKNGVKMSGMPGFGPTHTDEEIWAIAAFVKQLPNLDSAAYAGLQEKWCEKGEDDADCERHKMDCERQSDGTSHSHGPPEAIK